MISTSTIETFLVKLLCSELLISVNFKSNKIFKLDLLDQVRECKQYVLRFTG